MTPQDTGSDREAYYREGASWAAQQAQSTRNVHRIAWVIAAIATIVAVLEAIALIALTPFKTVVPYTLLVDRQTGFVQALKPLERDVIAPDRALTRSLLAQYVIAREGFDIDSLREDYKKVALWSSGEARDRYLASMQSTNPASPIATLPRRALVQVQIASVNSLNENTALVRFITTRTDPGGQPMPPEHWAAVLNWRFSPDGLSDADRLTNPFGFQVLRYRRNSELAPTEVPLGSVSPEVSSPATQVTGRAMIAPPAASTGAAQ